MGLWSGPLWLLYLDLPKREYRHGHPRLLIRHGRPSPRIRLGLPESPVPPWSPEPQIHPGGFPSVPVLHQPPGRPPSLPVVNATARDAPSREGEVMSRIHLSSNPVITRPHLISPEHSSSTPARHQILITTRYLSTHLTSVKCPILFQHCWTQASYSSSIAVIKQTIYHLPLSPRVLP